MIHTSAATDHKKKFDQTTASAEETRRDLGAHLYDARLAATVLRSQLEKRITHSDLHAQAARLNDPKLLTDEEVDALTRKIGQLDVIASTLETLFIALGR